MIFRFLFFASRCCVASFSWRGGGRKRKEEEVRYFSACFSPPHCCWCCLVRFTSFSICCREGLQGASHDVVSLPLPSFIPLPIGVFCPPPSTATTPLCFFRLSCGCFCVHRWLFIAGCRAAMCLDVVYHALIVFPSPLLVWVAYSSSSH